LQVFKHNLERIAENDGNEISAVDPDAHLMNQGGDGREYDACYNVIMAVDEKHKLIADFEVSTCMDEKGILPMLTENVKTLMGVTEISALADKGFYNGEDIEECEKNGTICFIPEVFKGKQAPEPEYNRENFKYDHEKDCYVCPAGAELKYRKTKKRKLRSGESEDERKIDKVYSNFAACQNFINREQCTTNKMGRDIYRNQYQDTLDITNARMLTKEGRTMFRNRKQIVEHPFGTTKHGWGYRNFLCRKIEKVTGEQSLVFLAYNFRRVFNIFKENGTKLQNPMA